MSYKLTLAFVIILGLMAGASYSQFYSELQYGSATSIEVQSGADMCADDIIISGTYSGTGTICLGALPVTLSSFSSMISMNNVTLQWSTVTELNNLGFKIERKMTGDSSVWQNIGFISGSGTTNEPKAYIFADNKLHSGSYFYRLKQIDYNGNFEYFLLSGEVIIAKPGGFALGQNYPNPSNPKSKIDFQVPHLSFVNISVFNLLGQIIVKLVNDVKEPGHYTAEFDGSNYPSGMYIYRITGEGFTDVKKMILVK